MKYIVVLIEKVDGNIHVTVPSLPDCIVEANTGNEALAKTHETISEIISRSEIVQLDLSVEPKSRNLPFNPHGSGLEDLKIYRPGGKRLMKSNRNR